MSKPDVQHKTLVVDLDGTLILSDILVENIFLFLRMCPFHFFKLFSWLFQGKAYFKKRLASEVMPDVTILPYNKQLIDWLRLQQNSGTYLVLASASDVRLVTRVASHLGIFDEVLGSKDNINLSAYAKRDRLVAKYGERGYAYVGNSLADLPVWQSAATIYTANPEFRVLEAARRIGKVEQVFESRPSYLRTLLKALRLHQWLKNLLVFVPFLASHRIMEIELFIQGVVAFIAFSVCASSVYLLNDLIDLQDDRQHRTKHLRPLASGTLPIFHAVVMIPLLLVLAFLLGAWILPFSFTIALTVYYFVTLTYSLWLKRIVMLDVITLALLYIIRVVAGVAAMSLVTTFWILTFCLFIFLSLAFAKRYTELYASRQEGGNGKAQGRGYYSDDFELLASLGGASGFIAVLVLALYINDATNGTLYRSPEWMWAACPLLLFWISRVWLIAHRGEMHDDPIVFAIRDKTSLCIGVLFIAVFVLASI